MAQNQISWIRRRDWHILSSGAQMYTNDERFAILHTPGSNTWTLQIKFVQRRDHGMYECTCHAFFFLSFFNYKQFQTKRFVLIQFSLSFSFTGQVSKVWIILHICCIITIKMVDDSYTFVEIFSLNYSLS